MRISISQDKEQDAHDYEATPLSATLCLVFACPVQLQRGISVRSAIFLWM